MELKSQYKYPMQDFRCNGDKQSCAMLALDDSDSMYYDKRRKCGRLTRWIWLFLSLLTAAYLFRLVRSTSEIYFYDLSTSDLLWMAQGRENADLTPARVAGNTFFVHGEAFSPKLGRKVASVKSEVTDVTQSYPFVDSADVGDQMEPRTFPKHESDPHCVPMAEWQTKSFPTCNEFHTLDFIETFDKDDLSLLSKKGFWRYAWELKNDHLLDRNDTGTHEGSVVLKTIKLEHNMEEAFFENNRVDALAMERLTSSPYITNIYGHCGMSVMTEFAGQQIPTVANKLDSFQRLRLARRVALGVADMHNIGHLNTPSLVHNDLNFANVFLRSDGVPVINDFNLGELLMRHDETNETCKFSSRFPSAQWKSPEEQANLTQKSKQQNVVSHKLLTYKTDIYALGNFMFRLATGRSPWKTKSGAGSSLSAHEKQAVAMLKMTNGSLPPIPDQVLSDPDPAIQALLNATRECYRFDPEQRPTAMQVSKMLKRAIVSIQQNKTVT